MSASSTETLSLNLETSSAPDSFHILPHNRASITFRCLHPGDQPEVKSLCHNWFPVEYPDQWYDDIAHNKKYFTLAACDRSTHAIVGLIVANVLPLVNCNYDDQKILHSSFSLNTSICYILVLGVVKEYRRQGLASLLLDNLIQTFDQRSTCKAIYLHVLHSNKQAIEFYRSKQFQYRVHLPSYYMINGDYFDALCFARYINDGYPPLTFADVWVKTWSSLAQTNPCRWLSKLGYFLINRIILAQYYQRTSPYKRISRII